MRNQAPLSPARVLYEELRENEDAGLLDTWPVRGEADQPAAAPGDARGPPVSAFPGPEDIPELTPELATRRPSATGYGDLAAIIRLQSTEIERLALENDRLAARLDAVSQLHEDERNQRRNLDQQLHDASLPTEPLAPALDVEEIRRAAREGMSAEIKPVLMAILDLLESTLPRGAETANPTAVVEEMPVSASASLVAEVMDDLQRLPEILTRPIEELTGGSGNAGSTPNRVAVPPALVKPQETRVRRPRPRRHGAQPSAMPSVFAWTDLFS